MVRTTEQSVASSSNCTYFFFLSILLGIVMDKRDAFLFFLISFREEFFTRWNNWYTTLSEKIRRIGKE